MGTESQVPSPGFPDSETREDCLIDMLRLGEGKTPVAIGELAAFMELGRDEMDAVLAALVSEGKVIVEDGSASFTDLGLLHAREIRKRHHVMESFLVNVLGMDHEAAHAEAHHMEHSMTQESMQRFCHVTGNVRDNDCAACSNPCDNMVTIGEVTSLSDMDAHSRGTIAYLRGSSPDDVRKLISMGFAPGREIAMEGRVSSNGPRIVSVGGSVIAVDAALSKIIYVNVVA